MKKKIKSCPVKMEDWVSEQIAYLKRTMKLSEYTFVVCYCKEDEIKERNGKKYETNASIDVDAVYLRATIHIPLAFKRAWDREEGTDYTRHMMTLVHEFCHIFTNPLADLGKQMIPNMLVDHFEDIVETTTQRIAVAFFSWVPIQQYVPTKRKRK